MTFLNGMILASTKRGYQSLKGSLEAFLHLRRTASTIGDQVLWESGVLRNAYNYLSLCMLTFEPYPSKSTDCHFWEGKKKRI